MPPLLDEIPSHVGSMLVFGGTFDPPHTGHVQLPEVVRQRLGLDWVLYIPAASPPLKDGPVASEHQRVEMLRLALEDATHATISSAELARGGMSYTHDTLLALHEQHPDIALRLLIGADQAIQFHKWRNAREIIALAEPVVMLRDDIEHATTMADQMRDHWSDDELDSWRQRFIPVTSVECSSTALRRGLSNPDGHASDLARYLGNSVLGYIRANSVYA
ncbi:MAG: nicotinate (nicotinamide) nucleotide adenylyltransferase [Phycisphaerales bacterium JB043]